LFSSIELLQGRANERVVEKGGFVDEVESEASERTLEELARMPRVYPIAAFFGVFEPKDRR